MDMPGFLPGIRRSHSPESPILCFRPVLSTVVSGTSLATASRMSPIARVLHDRFEEICRAELIRLRRKTAGFSAADRGELDDITLSIVRAIAGRVSEALDRDTTPETECVVTHLFAVTPPDQPAGSMAPRALIEKERDT